VVICDRYTDSTMAYQGYGRGLPKEFIAELNIRATNGVVPAKTVVLDIALSEAVRRRKESGPADRLEGEGNPFYERVRRGFLAVAQQEPERVVVVDGTPNAETVADSVRLAVVQSILDDVD
jgi:dTMP kinase